ncbi:hypothetical protein GCM10011384_21750 [Psychrobacillus lasiicapitis]|nr:hypothetical protein GCM10011384_21750 [Psychrobacillus lasiicapitis]
MALKIIIVILLLISYYDTISITKPNKTQTQFVKTDAFWAVLHTIAYGIAVGYVLFM